MNRMTRIALAAIAALMAFSVIGAGVASAAKQPTGDPLPGAVALPDPVVVARHNDGRYALSIEAFKRSNWWGGGGWTDSDCKKSGDFIEGAFNAAVKYAAWGTPGGFAKAADLFGMAARAYDRAGENGCVVIINTPS